MLQGQNMFLCILPHLTYLLLLCVLSSVTLFLKDFCLWSLKWKEVESTAHKLKRESIENIRQLWNKGGQTTIFTTMKTDDKPSTFLKLGLTASIHFTAWVISQLFLCLIGSALQLQSLCQAPGVAQDVIPYHDAVEHHHTRTGQAFELNLYKPFLTSWYMLKYFVLRSVFCFQSHIHTPLSDLICIS